ncbi:MAG TPA: condensation domain-containing protein, partial [Thermoanaerobaculia bacterium]|nr:condensation domain-containing protein [Thermoanaerobaculia bacterium]
LELIRRGFGVGPADRAVIWLPPYHDMGLIGGLLEPVYADFPVVLFSPMAFLQRPQRWLAAISRHRATVSGGPSFAYELAARKAAADPALDLSSWAVAFNGAEPIRADTLERFARAFAPCGFRREAFYPCYGLAEGTLFVTGAERGAGAAVAGFSGGELAGHRAVRREAGDDRRALVASGRSPAGQRLVVVEPETGAPCPPGTVGEIWVAGPSVARGYWRRPEETARAFGARLPGGEGPYLRTGDLGFLDAVEGGLLFVTGRIKDLMILRGRNVYPQDIEATVEGAHPALRPGGSAAFSIDLEGGAGAGGEEGLVVVQEVRREALREGFPAVAAAAAAAVRRAVAEEHEARLHALVLSRPATLPKTSSGKVRRHAARAAYLGGTLDTLWRWSTGEPVAGAAVEPAEEAIAGGAPGEGPGDPRDEAAVRAWLRAEVARRAGVPPEAVDPDLPAAEHGLDSLGAMEVAHAVEARFGVALPMERLLEGVTVAELAAELVAAEPEAESAATVTPMVEAPEGAGLPLSRNQLSLWFLHALEPESPAYNVPAALRLKGGLDAAALARAVDALVARHPALRTTFGVVRGEPRQRPRQDGPVEVHEEEAGGWSESAFLERLRMEARRPFDLEAGPLLRVHLFRRAAEEHVLLLVMHHIVTDFRSLGVLLDELRALYEAAEAGRTAELPPPGASYAEYVRWQEALLASPRGEELEAYWLRRLAGELPVLEL